MTVELTIVTAQVNTTIFDLFSDVDGFTVPFENNVLSTDLISTYTSSLVPSGTTTIRILSVSPECKNYIDVVLTTTTTTTI